ncbi:MAG: baseplate J/gp47 family protein [Thermoplasmata archaeon]|nr:baseplate J/gp47 family protein [Thermoplasmata archaeon]
MSVTPFENIGDPEEWPDPNAEMAWEETAVARPDIEGDSQVIAERIFDRLAERVPGWVAATANLETILIEEFAMIAAEIRAEAMTVPEAIFQTYGEEVLGLPITLGQSATGFSTWTARNDAGYQIPAAAQITVPRTGDDLVAFEVVQAVEIPPGDTTIENVQIRAMITGSQANALHGEAEAIDPFAWVEMIEVPEPTTGGLDGQNLEDYLSELVVLFRLVGLRPILPIDFAVLALRIPGVARAIAMDGYDPSDRTWGHARMITLVVTDADGEPCSGETKAQARRYLEALREVNWIVWVVDAEYETINVEFEVTAFAEQDAEIVEGDCIVTLTDALRPADYRLGVTSPSIAAGEVIPPPIGVDGFVTANVTPGRSVIRVNDLVALLDRTRGVDWIARDGVVINGDPDDYPLGGPTTLPRPGAITGTVNVQ